MERVKKGTAFETFHAAENLYERYGLKTPAKVFLDAIEAGEASEVSSPVAGRRVFDVTLQRSPSDETEIRVRTVVAFEDGRPRFVVTYLPPYFPGESFARGSDRAHHERLAKKKQSKQNLYRELRRTNDSELEGD